MVTLAEVEGQAASTIVCNYMVCRSCSFVEPADSLVGRPCSACNRSGGVALLYFPINIRVLVDLVQEAFHSYSSTEAKSGPDASSVGVLLFFSTLRETLLDHFLLSMLRKKQVDQSLIERLFHDNKQANQKFNNLFPAVTGDKWEEAVKAASTREGIDYQPVSNLMKTASKIRNGFLHEGRGCRATRDMARLCLNSLPYMTSLFVALNNIYISSSSHTEGDLPPIANI